ncbi:predicted protein [Histoplasma mississippiense (nom. inval.)]|uniref:predicted protein n=1 Tax=Ajellomyces capsulatus (strain NAm1 / WU24) TaxID=2059318 RepID=UPI000157C80F|nr:predicted protein [Histoplasma mississippiense (nom. inval.)]EDN09378.1 predicted protein [Histoplasma mississippiense (nom. inval.)]
MEFWRREVLTLQYQPQFYSSQLGLSKMFWAGGNNQNIHVTNHSNIIQFIQIHTFIIKSVNMPRNTHCSTASQACKRTPTTLHLHLPKPPVPDVPDNDENPTDNEKEDKKEEKEEEEETQSEDPQFL